MAHSCKQLTRKLHTKLLREPSSLDIAKILSISLSRPQKPQLDKFTKGELKESGFAVKN